MTDPELEQRLKAARVPDRPDAYWQEFPRRVTMALHWQDAAGESRAAERGGRFKLQLAWGAALAAVAAAIALVFAQRSGPLPTASASDTQLAKARKCYQEMETLFPNQLQAIVFDQQGPRMVLADKAEVPKSTPLYLRICSPGGCKGYVTFSGQQIQLDGQNCEVLEDAHGQVMLVGNDHVWQENAQTGDIRIEARPLEGAL